MTPLQIAALVAGGFALARYAVGLPLAVRYLLRARVASIPKGPTPPISVLKPLYGDEPGLEENLEATLRQNYPEFEVIFVHERPDDPAAARADAAAARVTDVPSRRMAGKDPDARNPKVSVLLRAEAAAAHEVFVAADSGVRPDPLWLRDAANALADRDLGAFPMVLFGMRSLGARLLGLFVDTEGFLSVVLGRGAVTPGATIAARRSALRAIGGYRAVADRIADDLELGRALRRQGFRAALARRAVRLYTPGGSVADAARRVVRWSLAIRSSAPLLYVVACLPSFAGPLLAAAAIAGPERALPLAALLAHLVARAFLATLVDFRFCWDRSLLRALPLLPLLWAIEPAAWLAGLLSRDVVWRGRRYRVSGGRATLVDA